MIETRQYFDRRARAFDRVYARPWPLRRGPVRGRDLAAAVVARLNAPAVLDVGCGPGRVGEAVLASGAASYVGVDLSPRMLALARARLGRGDRVELRQGDFLEVGLDRAFDVVLALGLLEYVDEPERAAAWLRRHCAGSLVASCTRWDRVKGPPRHLVHVLRGVAVRDSTEAEATALLLGAGFARVVVAESGPRGFHVVAEVPPAR